MITKVHITNILIVNHLNSTFCNYLNSTFCDHLNSTFCNHLNSTFCDHLNSTFCNHLNSTFCDHLNSTFCNHLNSAFCDHLNSAFCATPCLLSRPVYNHNHVSSAASLLCIVYRLCYCLRYLYAYQLTTPYVNRLQFHVPMLLPNCLRHYPPPPSPSPISMPSFNTIM